MKTEIPAEFQDMLKKITDSFESMAGSLKIIAEESFEKKKKELFQ